MAALRMDGTSRLKRDDAPALARKIIRAWFERNPRNVVSFHRRWNELTQASKEMMGAPRTAMVYPNRIMFGPHQSELSLANIAGCNVTDDNKLQIYFDGQGGVAVEYSAVA